VAGGTRLASGPTGGALGGATAQATTTDSIEATRHASGPGPCRPRASERFTILSRSSGRVRGRGQRAGRTGAAADDDPERG
jgi:hypothetical protein